jgi:hypothetical protein
MTGINARESRSHSDRSDRDQSRPGRRHFTSLADRMMSVIAIFMSFLSEKKCRRTWIPFAIAVPCGIFFKKVMKPL